MLTPDHALKPFTIRMCAAYVAQETGLSVSDVMGASRRYKVVAARSIVIRLAHDRNVTLTQIARRLGDMCHSTIIHSLQHFERYMSEWPELRDVYEGLCE